VTNAHEAIWQDVKQEATDELVGWQCHGASAVAMLSISVREGDARALSSLGNREDAIVREGYPMGVAAKIVQDFLGRREGAFGIDHPLLLAE
jgi:hypothetical protein